MRRNNSFIHITGLEDYDCIPPEQVKHVALLLRLKAAGFTLDEIYVYTTYRGQGSETIPTRLRLMNEKIVALQKKQEDITASIKYLKEKIDFLENQK